MTQPRDFQHGAAVDADVASAESDSTDFELKKQGSFDYAKDVELQRRPSASLKEHPPLLQRLAHSKSALLLCGLVIAVLVALAVAIPVGILHARGDQGDMEDTTPKVSPAPGR